MWTIEKALQNSLNSFAVNLVSLSDTIVSGIPNLAKSSSQNLTARRVFTLHYLWPLRETVNHNRMILSLHWTSKIYVQSWPRSVRLCSRGKFYCWHICCYRNHCRILHFLLFLCPYSAKKHWLSLKLSILVIPAWKSFNVLFFSAPGITTRSLYIKIPSQMEKSFHHQSVLLLVINLFLFLWYICLCLLCS